jgi:hypothetical protein
VRASAETACRGLRYSARGGVYISWSLNVFVMVGPSRIGRGRLQTERKPRQYQHNKEQEGRKGAGRESRNSYWWNTAPRSGSSLEMRMEACVIRIDDGLGPTVAARHNSQGTKCTAPNNTHIHNVSINTARLEDSCRGHKHISNRIKGDPPKVRDRATLPQRGLEDRRAGGAPLGSEGSTNGRQGV